jgi:hypothetical protein
MRNLRGSTFSWYLGGVVARYCGGHGPSCKWFLMDSWGLWCQVVAEAGCSGGAVVMAVGECGSLAGAVVVDCCRGGASGLIVDMTFALVVEASYYVLQFCQPHTLSVYVLSLSLGLLGGCLTSHE